MQDSRKGAIDRAEWKRLLRDFQRFSATCAGRQNLRAWIGYWRTPQYRVLIYYRLASIVRIRGLRNLFHRFYRFHSLRTGIELSRPIGGGLIMPHWGRIILDAKSIGHDLYVLHNVTVGDDYVTGRPTIGNGVFIGTGAVIVGNITIGDHAMIGAMSFVNKDVPPCTLAAGNPAQPIRKIEPDHVSRLTGYGAGGPGF